MRICQDVYELMLVGFGENSETGSVARKENWMVHQKQKCFVKLYYNAAKCCTY